jgi:hypothetical protein
MMDGWMDADAPGRGHALLPANGRVPATTAARMALRAPALIFFSYWINFFEQYSSLPE